MARLAHEHAATRAAAASAYADAERFDIHIPIATRPAAYRRAGFVHEYEEIRKQSQTLESVGAYYPLTLSLVTQREPEAIFWSASNGDFFQRTGDFPIHAGNVRYAEETLGGNDVAVITMDSGTAILAAMTLFLGGRSRWMGKT